MNYTLNINKSIGQMYFDTLDSLIRFCKKYIGKMQLNSVYLEDEGSSILLDLNEIKRLIGE
jgi:hypothetical protein